MMNTRVITSHFDRGPWRQILRHLVLHACPLLLALPALAQSTDELRSLFFDPVLLEANATVLQNSGDRPGLDSSATAAPSPSPARSSSEILADINTYENVINRQIENSGIYNTELAQEYLATGNLYKQLGDTERAIAAYENAMHISRVNEGLYTLSQQDAVRALIDISEDSRNFAEADKYHEYLYYLLSRNLEPGSDAMASASLEWAEWNLESFRREAFLDEEGLRASDVGSVGSSMLRRGELVAVRDNQFSEILFIPRTGLLGQPGVFRGQLSSREMANIRMLSFTADQLVDPRLKQAEALYDTLLASNVDAADMVKRKANLTHLFQKQLEQYISFNSFGLSVGASHSRAMRSVSVLRRGYTETRDELTELAMAAEATEPLTAAALYRDVGDWELAFERQSRAVQSYNKAREILLAEGLAETQVTEFISPEPALLIPEFVSHEYTRDFQNIPEDRNVPYKGYIDVSFDKRANGSLRRIDIIGASENTSQRLRSLLLDNLDAAVMRPLFMAGETVEQSDIKVRYYYSF